MIPRRELLSLIGAVIALSSGVVEADYPNSVLNDSPRGFWRFEDLGMTATNAGTGGMSLDGTFVNGQSGAAGPSELPDGTVLHGIPSSNRAFDAGAAFVSVESPLLSGLQEFTLSGWIYPRALPSVPTGIIGQLGAVAFGFVDQNTLAISTAEGGDVSWQFGEVEIATNQWSHVAAVGRGSQLELYHNGQLVASGGSAIGSDYGQSDAAFQIAGGGIMDSPGNAYRGTVDEVAIWDTALTPEQIESHFQSALAANQPGDFNGDSRFDLVDVNLLQQAIFDESTDIVFDLSNDEEVTLDDLDVWVTDIRLTFFGDANLDGEFNVDDLLAVFQIGEYVDGEPLNSRWEEGDWNADFEFDSDDLLTAFQDGGYENGPLMATAVPEPNFGVWWILVGWQLQRGRRR